jgi:hypothetical protein
VAAPSEEFGREYLKATHWCRNGVPRAVHEARHDAEQAAAEIVLDQMARRLESPDRRSS